LKIIPRGVQLLDYTPGVASGMPVNDRGAADRIHGEAGDDDIYGGVGNDLLFGDGQDDDIIGGSGSDWISGGAGQDGILGDDGRIFTSRNSTSIGESLFGIAPAAAGTLDFLLATPGNRQQAIINPSGALKKTVDLNPFTTGGNDVIYGGLGSDFLHGGAGNDAISGAEALPNFFSNPSNNGDPLPFGHIDPTYFDAYDPFNPMKKISGFLLNFNATDVLPDNSTTTDDGNDNIFGDTGNDWIVGGTGADWMFGGYGNDEINADGNLDTNGGLNDQTDPVPFASNDIAFGGAGLDVLIANTGSDRLIDWSGEFNSYLVPFSPFGSPTISRSVQPALFDFLYKLSASVGSDPTRLPGFGTDVPIGSDPARNGEPYGEIGLVTQQDPDWNAQHGGPRDPQPGNTNGPRDTRKLLDFSSAANTGFFTAAGTWNVTGGKYAVTPANSTSDAISLQYLDDDLPKYSETTVTINTGSGTKSNGYVIFDYQNATNFKFAGIDVATGNYVIGARTASGWTNLATKGNNKFKANTDYTIMVTLNGSTASISSGNSTVLSYSWPTTDPLNDGLLALGTTGSTATFDNYQVQVLPPDIYVAYNLNFGNGSAPFTNTLGTWTTASGIFKNATTSGNSIALLGGYTLEQEDFVEVSGNLSTLASGGLVFNYNSATDYKFILLAPGTNQIVMGHVYGGVTTYDTSVNAGNLKYGTNYAFTLSIRNKVVNFGISGVGSSASLSYTYAGDLINSGNVGVISQNGVTSFSAFNFDIRR